MILSTIGGMFASNHHSMVGSEEDPEDGGKVAAAVFGAVGVYGVRSQPKSILEGYALIKTPQPQVFLLFCACQAIMHKRQSGRGEIALR